MAFVAIKVQVCNSFNLYPLGRSHKNNLVPRVLCLDLRKNPACDLSRGSQKLGASSEQIYW